MEAIKSLFLLITLNFLCCIEANSFGFTTSLIHRDSLLSPYFNPSNTYYENLHNSIRRAMARSNKSYSPMLASSSSSIQSPLTAVPGEFLMKISLGTPSVDLLAVADTGSDLTWTQCEPCIKCYKQDSPLFNPQKSSTYEHQPCQSNACQALSTTSCDHKNKCNYVVSYGDGSYSKGDLSLESLTFESTSGNPVIFPNISIGCGHSNGGKFDKFTTGIVGLGNGELSIVNQLSDTVNGKFSYCLAPVSSNVSSKISFGSNAVVSGSGVQTTPLYTKDHVTVYNLNLESVSVGDTNIKFETKKNTKNASADESNIIIDSGTTLTFLPDEFYDKFQQEFRSKTVLTPVKGQVDGLIICYKKEEGFEEKVPTVTFHFSGADLDLNTMLEVEQGVVCLSIVPATYFNSVPVFGNLQQMNYLIGYDLDSKTVSFKKSDCANL